MKTFPLRVLAPERTFFDGACTSLTVPSIDGMYGLMAQHEDIVLAIVPGKLTLRDADGVEQIAAVSEGVLKMERGEAWIAPYYAGDYLMMAEENEDLRFCFPEEGFNFFIDALCIPTCATNKEGAEAYINFLCSPEVNGENLDYLGYSTPESAAKEYMDPETHLMDSLWLEVKTEGETDYTPIIGISATVLLAAVYLTARGVRDRRRRANRCKKWKT
mgnify:CR=1 FL=1